MSLPPSLTPVGDAVCVFTGSELPWNAFLWWSSGELTLSPGPQEGNVHDEQSEDVRNPVKDLTGIFAKPQWGAGVITRDHGRPDL